MKYIYLALMSLFLLGCSTKDINDVLAATAGNKPPQFFKFTSPEKVEKWYFETKDYKALPPQTYHKDWKLMSGWNGAYIYNGISFGTENPDVDKVGLYLGYGINLHSSISNYNQEDTALERGDVGYFKKNYVSGIDKFGKNYWINYHIEHHGKENYPCVVYDTISKSRGFHNKTYVCHKYNKDRTKDKEVVVEFIYTKSPKLPKKYQHLTKEYTYEDLLKRSQRVLDSLYIKDGWDE